MTLHSRNAINDLDHVPSDEVFAGRMADAPTVSITIPTCRRPDLLKEAVASALAQEFDEPFEVVVVDDDPDSDGHLRLLAAMPGLEAAPLRYLRNRRNLGMYPNFNRSIQAARGEWITILHDDDLIHSLFARRMLARIRARPELRGLICRKANRDDRAVPVTESQAKQWARRGVDIVRFGFGDSRGIDARKLFWECIGNTVGFICRKRDVEAIGGFYPEEHPSCDYFFYLRFAERFGLEECREVLASIRIADNTLLKKEYQLACAERNTQARLACIAMGAPHWWLRLSPLLLARQVTAMERFYRVDMTSQEVGSHLGVRIPRDRPLLLNAVRFGLRGF